jgi:hypothetical protein
LPKSGVPKVGQIRVFDHGLRGLPRFLRLFSIRAIREIRGHFLFGNDFRYALLEPELLPWNGITYVSNTAIPAPGRGKFSTLIHLDQA